MPRTRTIFLLTSLSSTVCEIILHHYSNGMATMQKMAALKCLCKQFSNIRIYISVDRLLVGIVQSWTDPLPSTTQESVRD